MVYDNPVTGVRRYRMEMLELPQGLLLEFVTDLMTQHPTGCLRVAESTLTPFVPEKSDLNATIAVAARPDPAPEAPPVCGQWG